MIDDPPLLEIARNVLRPAADIVAAFRDTPTSFICDAMGGRGALDWRIKPVGAPLPFAGVAFTSYSGPADNLGTSAATALCEPGDVLVAATDGFTGTAVAGDLTLGIAKNRGAVAFITDGMVRDVRDIEALGLPCYAAGMTPNSPARNGPGSVGLPVQCGGLLISSGDIIVGDRDGVAVVPQASIADVLSRLKAVRAAEATFLKQVQGGLRDLGFVSDLLKSDRVRFIDT